MAERPAAMIELDGVGYEYATAGRRVVALDGISLVVPRGECVAFVGASGSGKSTLLRLIAGLTAPSRGSVSVDGRPARAPIRAVAIGFQNPALLPWRTVLGNVLLPAEILETGGGAADGDRAGRQARARELLRMVGLEGAALKKPGELSGGMRQRVSLCRALVQEPELLLLDEPFTALDTATREEMWRLHQALRQDRQLTAVVATHDLLEAVFLADTIHALAPDPGRVAHTHRVPLPFPRSLADCHSAEATALIAVMRGEIHGARG